ncbi:hypothetical protein ALT1000_140080 [Alteromonas macleodii]
MRDFNSNTTYGVRAAQQLIWGKMFTHAFLGMTKLLISSDTRGARHVNAPFSNYTVSTKTYYI